MQLLELDDQTVSLEFDVSETDVVLARLRDVLRASGVTTIRRSSRVTLDIIEAGHHRFTLGTEPGESCLIAATGDASRLLRAIASGNAAQAA